MHFARNFCTLRNETNAQRFNEDIDEESIRWIEHDELKAGDLILNEHHVVEIVSQFFCCNFDICSVGVSQPKSNNISLYLCRLRVEDAESILVNLNELG